MPTTLSRLNVRGRNCHREEGDCDRRGAVSDSERVLLGCDLMPLIRRLHLV